MTLFRPLPYPTKALFTLLRQPFVRTMSSKMSLVDLTVDREGIAVISMKRQPVNSINLELLQELNSTLELVQKNHCKGLVITSATRVFSAGMDLNEFYKPELNRLNAFWSAFIDLALCLYGSGEIVSTTAINGYAAAGGCAISMLCDYRVMVANSQAKIGLNDTEVGIVPRPWLCDVMTQVMGHRQAEIALTASTMHSAEEALKVNMIDEMATDTNDAIEKCKQFIRRYDNIPIAIKAKTKRLLRENTIKVLETNREEEWRQFNDSISDPFVQERIECFMRQLKSRKEPKYIKQ